MSDLRIWKHPGNYIGQRWDGWLVFLSRNRDSRLLDNHNFETAWGRVHALDEDHPMEDTRTVLKVSENHWACGWVEWIAIHPSNTRAVECAKQICRALDNYPILNEIAYYAAEGEARMEAWRDLSIRDRIELINRRGNVSILAARRDWPPDDDAIREILERWVSE